VSIDQNPMPTKPNHKTTSAISDKLLDDVIVSGHNALGNAVSLEIQAKRNIDFTPSDEVFAAVMVQVSDAVRDPDFWNVKRELAVATAHHSRQIDSAYQGRCTREET
jgi:hypothetical protein